MLPPNKPCVWPRLRPRPHECVFKSLRFHFTENAMKVLRPHDRFQIVLPVHTETMKTTENAFNLLLRMYRRRYTFNCQFPIKLNRSEIPIKNNNNTFSVDILHLGFFKWKWTGTEITWPIDFKSLRFRWIWPVHTKPILLRFQILPLWRVISKVCVFTENGTRKHDKMFAFSNENAFVWTEPNSAMH